MESKNDPDAVGACPKLKEGKKATLPIQRRAAGAETNLDVVARWVSPQDFIRRAPFFQTSDNLC
jgi:hypothetical protein